MQDSNPFVDISPDEVDNSTHQGRNRDKPVIPPKDRIKATKGPNWKATEAARREQNLKSQEAVSADIRDLQDLIETHILRISEKHGIKEKEIKRRVHGSVVREQTRKPNKYNAKVRLLMLRWNEGNISFTAIHIPFS